MSLEQTVHRLLAKLDEAAENSDSSVFVSNSSEHIVFMPPNGPAVVGRKAVLDWYHDFYEQFTLEVTHLPFEVEVFGQLVVHRGVATGNLTPKSAASPIPFENKYLYVLEKKPLRFRYVMFSNNQERTDPIKDQIREHVEMLMELIK